MTDLSQRDKHIANAKRNALADTPRARLAAIAALFKMRAAALTEMTGNAQKTRQLFNLLLGRCNRQPDLLTCDPVSLYIAATKIASFGLSAVPERKHFYLIPYRNKELGNRKEATFRVSHHGYTYLAKAHPDVEDVWTDVVYRGEPFSYDRFAGTITHQVGERSNVTEGQLVAAYCVIRLRSGKHIFEVLTGDQVRKRQRKAQSQDFWKAWPEEMWKKTAALALLRSERAPKISALEDALKDESPAEEIVPATFTVQDEEPLAEELPDDVDADAHWGDLETEQPEREPGSDDAADSSARPSADSSSQDSGAPAAKESAAGAGPVKKPTERDLLLEKVWDMAISIGVPWPEIGAEVATINAGRTPAQFDLLTMVQLRHIERWLIKKGAHEPKEA